MRDETGLDFCDRSWTCNATLAQRALWIYLNVSYGLRGTAHNDLFPVVLARSATVGLRPYCYQQTGATTRSVWCTAGLGAWSHSVFLLHCPSSRLPKITTYRHICLLMTHRSMEPHWITCNSAGRVASKRCACETTVYSSTQPKLKYCGTVRLVASHNCPVISGSSVIMPLTLLSPTSQIVTLCHADLTYHFRFLAFGHSGAQP